MTATPDSIIELAKKCGMHQDTERKYLTFRPDLYYEEPDGWWSGITDEMLQAFFAAAKQQGREERDRELAGQACYKLQRDAYAETTDSHDDVMLRAGTTIYRSPMPDGYRFTSRQLSVLKYALHRLISHARNSSIFVNSEAACEAFLRDANDAEELISILASAPAQRKDER